jgi:hypothetical protein
MIQTILSISLFAIFTTIGFIHFYWLFGGKWGINNALPTEENGEKAMKPPRIATAIVALGLISFGLLYLVKTGIFNNQVPNWIITYGGWIIPTIFILRTIGDFKYVGLFKKIKHTNFAKADTNFFVPLCLSIGIIGIIIQLMNK